MCTHTTMEKGEFRNFGVFQMCMLWTQTGISWLFFPFSIPPLRIKYKFWTRLHEHYYYHINIYVHGEGMTMSEGSSLQKYVPREVSNNSLSTSPIFFPLIPLFKQKNLSPAFKKFIQLCFYIFFLTDF